jgi:hypothetical protein
MSKISFGLTPHGKHVLVNLRYNDLEIDEKVLTFFRDKIIMKKSLENVIGFTPYWDLVKHKYYNNLSFKVYEVPCMKFDKNHGIKYQSTKKVVKIEGCLRNSQVTEFLKEIEECKKQKAFAEMSYDYFEVDFIDDLVTDSMWDDISDMPDPKHNTIVSPGKIQLP